MNNIVVCVTLQNTCKNLINYASSIRKDDDKLFVLHVAKNGENFMGSVNEAQTLEFLYSVSQEVNADMTVVHSDNVAQTIIDFINQNEINILVLGSPNKSKQENGLISTLNNHLRDKCKIILVDKQKGENNNESFFNSNRT